MSFSYDPELPETLDQVRFHMGDTVKASALLSDEEINALITEVGGTDSGLPFRVAARGLSAVLSKLAASTGTVRSKSIGGLAKSWGVDGGSVQVLRDRIHELKVLGSVKQQTKGHAVLRTL